MENRRNVTVFLADDNESTLNALTSFLRDENYSVVGMVRDGAALVEKVPGAHPDVAVADLFMPEMNGIQAAAQLRKINCDTKVVILTAHRELEFVRAAFASGALGYVLKHRLVTDLPRAIEGALRGERFLSPPLATPEPRSNMA